MQASQAQRRVNSRQQREQQHHRRAREQGRQREVGVQACWQVESGRHLLHPRHRETDRPDPASQYGARQRAQGKTDQAHQQGLEQHQPTQSPGRQPERHHDTEFTGSLEYRHQLRIQHTEGHEHDEDAVSEKGRCHIGAYHLFQSGLQRVPVGQHNAVRQQRQYALAHALNLGQGRRIDHDMVSCVAHEKHVLESGQRHFGDAAIKVGDAAVEDADDVQNRRRERAVTPAAENRQLVADIDTQVAREDAADDHLVACLDVAPLLHQPRYAGDTRLVLRLNAVHRDAVTAVVARGQYERGRACTDICVGQLLP